MEKSFTLYKLKILDCVIGVSLHRRINSLCDNFLYCKIAKNLICQLITQLTQASEKPPRF